MKLKMKIDPNRYPLIIIAAFVLGIVLAIVLGFRPQHGTHERGASWESLPALVQTIPANQLYCL